MEMQKSKIKYIIAATVFLADYLTKFIMANKDITIIKSFLSFKYTKNYGAAWSIFQNQRLVLILIGIIFLFLIIKYSQRFKNCLRNKISFGLLIGGLLGNLLDRIIFGYVRDFISLKFGSYYYPVFNIADMAIVIGVIMILIAVIKKEDSNAKN